MNIAKLILHYNTPAQTIKLAQMVPDAIIIDNGSLVNMNNVGLSNKVIRFETNLGFTKNWNRIIRAFTHENRKDWMPFGL